MKAWRQEKSKGRYVNHRITRAMSKSRTINSNGASLLLQSIMKKVGLWNG